MSTNVNFAEKVTELIEMSDAVQNFIDHVHPSPLQTATVEMPDLVRLMRDHLVETANNWFMLRNHLVEVLRSYTNPGKVQRNLVDCCEVNTMLQLDIVLETICEQVESLDTLLV